jgi:hypothetical protein
VTVTCVVSIDAASAAAIWWWLDVIVISSCSVSHVSISTPNAVAIDRAELALRSQPIILQEKRERGSQVTNWIRQCDLSH